MIERLFHLPPPSVPLTVTLYLILIVGCLVAAANVLPRLGGGVVAAALHLVGGDRHELREGRPLIISRSWSPCGCYPLWGSHRSVAQRGTLRTGRMGAEVHPDLCGPYLLLIRTHQDPQWRLEHHQLAGKLDPDVGDHPAATRARSVPTALSRAASLMQWFSFIAELTAVVVLWLRGRALLAAAVFWMGFHVFTLAILYIHFAPTAVAGSHLRR